MELQTSLSNAWVFIVKQIKIKWNYKPLSLMLGHSLLNGYILLYCWQVLSLPCLIDASDLQALSPFYFFPVKFSLKNHDNDELILILSKHHWKEMFKRNNLLFNFLSLSRFCWLNLPVHWQTWSLSLFVISKSFLNLFTSWEAWLFWMEAWVDSVLYVSAACIIQMINLQVFDLIFISIYVNPNCAWTNTYDVRFIQTFNFQKHY